MRSMEAKDAKRAKEAKSSFKRQLAPGYKWTEVGVMPEDWTIETLGELGKWLSGGTPSMSEKTYWDGSIPWVSPKERRLTAPNACHPRRSLHRRLRFLYSPNKKPSPRS